MDASLRAVSANESTSSPKPEVKENIFGSLIFNIALPVFVLMRLSKDPTAEGAPFYALGPTWALIIGVSIPLAYGIYDFNRRRKVPFMSLLGFFVVLIKGLFGLFKLAPIWFACSEAALPLMFGIAILLNSRARPPMVQ
ncbi:MAG: VC0807 family protein, partial [Verrucomicrobiota bacterium]